MMELKLVVVPENMPVAVFSIDGTFAANFSISGREPKIRLSSMELVRFVQWYVQWYVNISRCAIEVCEL